MRTAILATISYAVCKICPFLLLTVAMRVTTPTPPRPDPTGDLLVALYLQGVSTALSVAAFFVTTVWSAAWRRAPARRAVIIAGVLGLISPVVSLFAAALASTVLLPLLRSGSWIGLVLFYSAGGFALGGVALAIVKLWPGRRPAGASII